ncbi:S8 family serine peptidase [Inhella inkyongensis]|uniref:S8 family serine peptidase n=1 Tax=Inhella inkyongensis TaxID=392593 RepID=UPI0028732609|nr:S8 family serine peptidase [Inhella inkyongensis]
MAGTIAAVGNNSFGYTGVAPKTKIVPVRVLGRCGGAESDIADGIVWAVGGKVGSLPLNANPVRILNLSLGGEHSCSSTYQDAINYARNLKALIVVSAGNDKQDVSEQAPANCSGVMAVAATNKLGAKADYSNFGNGVDIAAPGGDSTNGGVWSLGNMGTKGPTTDGWSRKSGTSMAAPHVAGVAALMLATNSLLQPSDTAYLMKTTARSFPGTCTDCGTGIVDAEAAVAAAKYFRYEVEPNDSMASAQYVNLTGKARVLGTLQAAYPEKVDIYSMYIPAGHTLVTQLRMLSFDINFTGSMELMDATGKVLKKSVMVAGHPEANYYNGTGAGLSVYLKVKGSSSQMLSTGERLYEMRSWRNSNTW